jgi:hypothetical protein
MNYVAVCDIPFVKSSNRVVCKGTLSSANPSDLGIQQVKMSASDFQTAGTWMFSVFIIAFIARAIKKRIYPKL